MSEGRERRITAPAEWSYSLRVLVEHNGSVLNAPLGPGFAMCHFVVQLHETPTLGRG
jgi:hypothetical protein